MKVWLVLGCLLPSMSSFATNDPCLISFYGSEVAGRKRAQKILNANASARSNLDQIRQAKEMEAIVTVGSMTDPGENHVGYVWDIGQNSFRLGTRLGDLVTIHLNRRDQYTQIESQTARDNRYNWVKSQASVAARALIEAAEQAQLQRRGVEVRFTANQYSRYFRQTFTGRVHLVDLHEVWERSDKGPTKAPDRIAIWLSQPSLRSDLISSSGHTLLALPALSMPTSAAFDLTGPEAIQAHQFRLID